MWMQNEFWNWQPKVWNILRKNQHSIGETSGGGGGNIQSEILKKVSEKMNSGGT